MTGTAVLSLSVYISFLFWSAVYCAVAIVPWLLSLLLPRRISSRIMRYIVLGFGFVAVRCAMRPFFRIVYQDHSGAGREVMLHVFNHRSGSDPFLIAVIGMEIVQFVNGWPMRLPFFGYFARLCEYVDVTRTSYPDMVSHVRDLAARGVSVVTFPEGHRSCSREMLPFHSGAFRIAIESGMAICPCAIAGNEDIPDRHFRFRRRGTIVVRRLKPITAEEIRSYPSAFALKRRVREIIAAETAEIDKELDEGRI